MEIEEKYSFIESLQCIANVTALDSTTYLVTTSINIKPIDNQLKEMIFGGENSNTPESVRSIHEFIQYLANEEEDGKSLLGDRISAVIEYEDAIIYFGSVNSARIKDLVHLPGIIKAMAEMSGHQWRIGLFRLSATIIVVGIVSSATASLAWEGTTLCRVWATKIIEQLWTNDDIDRRVIEKDDSSSLEPILEQHIENT
jgi:hypothetical protein